MREEILKNAHKYEVKDLARQYFKDSGMDIINLSGRNLDDLKDFIQIEIDKLLADDSYSMIKDLKVKDKIKNYEAFNIN